MGQAMFAGLSRPGAPRAREALLGAATAAVVVVALVLAALGVTSAEVVATVLFLPVFAAGLLGGRVAGYVAAGTATVLYLALRSGDLSGAGVASAGVLALTRAAAYGVAGHVGGLAQRFVAGAGTAAAPRGAGARTGRAPGTVDWDDPWAGERAARADERTQPVLAAVGSHGTAPSYDVDEAGYGDGSMTTSGAWPPDPPPEPAPEAPGPYPHREPSWASGGGVGDEWADGGGDEWRGESPGAAGPPTWGPATRSAATDDWEAVQQSWRRQNGLGPDGPADSPRATGHDGWATDAPAAAAPGRWAPPSSGGGHPSDPWGTPPANGGGHPSDPWGTAPANGRGGAGDDPWGPAPANGRGGAGDDRWGPPPSNGGGHPSDPWGTAPANGRGGAGGDRWGPPPSNGGGHPSDPWGTAPASDRGGPETDSWGTPIGPARPGPSATPDPATQPPGPASPWSGLSGSAWRETGSQPPAWDAGPTGTVAPADDPWSPAAPGDAWSPPGPRRDEPWSSGPETERPWPSAPERDEPWSSAAPGDAWSPPGPRRDETWASGPDTGESWASGPEADESWASGPETDEPWSTRPDTNESWASGSEPDVSWSSGPGPDDAGGGGAVARATGSVPAVPPAAPPAPSRAEAEAVDLPAVDPETGLWTARFLRDRLAAERARSRRSGHPCSIVLVQVPDGPLAQLPYRRQVTLLRELGYQFVTGGVVDHLVHVPDQQQHWFAVILPDTDRSGAQVLERRLRLGIGGYLASRGLRLRDLESASLTAPDDDPAMEQIWEALIGPEESDGPPGFGY